jgi:hypothetical protein
MKEDEDESKKETKKRIRKVKESDNLNSKSIGLAPTPAVFS